jgi:signal transduction histidine kinase
MSEESLEQISFEMGTIMLNDSVPFSQKLQNIVPVLSGYLKASKCSIMIINREQLTLEVRASTNEAIIGLKRELSDVTIATRAIIDDKPFHVASGERSFFDKLDSSAYQSDYSLSVPVKYLDRKLGVINFTDFASTAERDDEIERRAMAIIRHFAAYLSAELGREELETKIGKLEEANQKLQQLGELKTNLTGFIIHDLKGPISTIMANLDMLGYDPLTPEQSEYLGLATEDVFRMQNMVMDILDVMKLEDGAISIFREDVDIKTLIEKEAASFANIIARKNIALEINAESHVSYLDENLIGRVIVNILRNAIAHSPDGGRIIISACYDDRPKEVAVSISDQGCGIPEDMREKIFEKYCRSDEDLKSAKIGTGMGLTFCRLVVAAHGGNIWAGGAESGGAKFVFTLPETLHLGL